ncbi:MAG: hypothetical protein QGG54_02070 [Gammaproteobacteria bacterium]|jgi:hypothetical protein|nr:hypothetical protein [Gammaproteobacteria bacterium]MDP6652844.1 hypothetical protein [Gammaproteobacteria bacterium]|tara:strand:+ start:2240 stop:2419 length:180 start_codon:yes stop_codon:yes gene_type:complete
MTTVKEYLAPKIRGRAEFRDAEILVNDLTNGWETTLTASIKADIDAKWKFGQSGLRRGL